MSALSTDMNLCCPCGVQPQERGQPSRRLQAIYAGNMITAITAPLANVIKATLSLRAVIQQLKT